MLTTGDPREVANRPDAGVPGVGKQGDRDQERPPDRLSRLLDPERRPLRDHRHRHRRLDDRRHHRRHQPRRARRRRVAGRHDPELGVQLADRRRDRAEGVVRPRPDAADTERADREVHGVSGYDAGSVIDKVYSTNKLIATDRDGPTARVKFGTEGTTGFNRVTIRDVHLRPIARVRARVGGRRRAARRRHDRRAHAQRQQFADFHPAGRSRPHAGDRDERE